MSTKQMIDAIDVRLNGKVIPTTGLVQVDAKALGELRQQRDDLLAALEVCQAFIDQVPERNALGTEAWSCYHEARAAIKRAKGE